MNKVTASAKTLLLVFVATIVGLIIANGASILEINSWSDAKPYVAAGLAAVIAYVYNWLSPYDSRYGISS